MNKEVTVLVYEFMSIHSCSSCYQCLCYVVSFSVVFFKNFHCNQCSVQS